MFRFFRLFKEQYLGFWSLGLALFAIQELPYMVMPLFKLEANPIMNMKESSAALDVAEKILGSLCIALIIFIVHKESKLFSIADGREKLFFILTVSVLLNFIGWAVYFAGHQSVFVMMFFIVLMPPLYYVCIGLWRNNVILAVTGGIFLIVHFVHVWGNLRLENSL